MSNIYKPLIAVIFIIFTMCTSARVLELEVSSNLNQIAGSIVEIIEKERENQDRITFQSGNNWPDYMFITLDEIDEVRTLRKDRPNGDLQCEARVSITSRNQDRYIKIEFEDLTSTVSEPIDYDCFIELGKQVANLNIDTTQRIFVFESDIPQSK